MGYGQRSDKAKGLLPAGMEAVSISHYVPFKLVIIKENGFI